MRAFINEVTAVEGRLNVRGYMQARRPPRWNLAWEAVLPSAMGNAAADEGWRDLKGNLLEPVVLPNDRFDFCGLGLGYSSVIHHRPQILTPRMKGGSFGARCMRLKQGPGGAVYAIGLQGARTSWNPRRALLR
jgi:hypothetical protein